MSDQPVDQPTPAATPAVDKLAIARAAALEKSQSHDRAQCLCPYCRGYRKQNNMPNPTKPAVVRQPKPQAAPTGVVDVISPSAQGGVVHDKDACPCSVCKEWRTERARLAANARYAKEAAEAYDWEHQPLLEAEQHLANLRLEVEKGARALNQRYTTANDPFVKCVRCGGNIPNGRWVMQKTLRDDATGLFKAIFFCSASCVQLYNSGTSAHQHGPASGEPTGLHPEQSPQARAERAAKAEAAKAQ